MPQATYLIGREPDPTRPRIILEDRSVSRTHASISPVGSGNYVLEDLNSANGTYVREQGGWRRIQRVDLHQDDEVRLGAYITTIDALLQRAIRFPGPVQMERNPDTGEIVKKAR